MFKKALALALPVTGLLVLAAYLNFSVFGIPMSERVQLILAFAIGPVAIMGVMQIKWRLEGRSRGHSLEVSTVFLIIAFAVLCLMIIVQQALFINYKELLAGADSASNKELIKSIFLLVNPVQLGLDVAFDVFYCIGLVGLSVSILGMGTKMKILGIYGALTGIGLLVLNLLSFPTPPGESELIDLGPATAVFWIGLVILLWLENRRKHSLNRTDKSAALSQD